MSDGRIHLALTMGDPAGIGPEIILKALRDLEAHSFASRVRLSIIGAQHIMNTALSLLDITELADNEALRSLIEIRGNEAPRAVVPGKTDAYCGHLAFRSIEHAIQLAIDGEVDGIVTAPISKEALKLAGYRYPGHTEILRDLTGSSETCMLLVHGALRVSHVTTHIALEDVPKHITPERLTRVIGLTNDAISDMGCPSPRIAVCALNPHAGEGGLFGHQDQEVIAPVIAQLRSTGIDVSGPVPGDTIFVRARAGQFDAVVAMYHDQGHIPVKLLGFSVDEANGAWTTVSGVNVTLGCPIVRTSVDHGTAFDIAGKGIADARSMMDAIELAAELCQQKKDPRGKAARQTMNRSGRQS